MPLTINSSKKFFSFNFFKKDHQAETSPQSTRTHTNQINLECISVRQPAPSLSQPSELHSKTRKPGKIKIAFFNNIFCFLRKIKNEQASIFETNGLNNGKFKYFTDNSINRDYPSVSMASQNNQGKQLTDDSRINNEQAITLNNEYINGIMQHSLEMEWEQWANNLKSDLNASTDRDKITKIDRALERIVECYRTGSTELNLSRLSLSCLPQHLPNTIQYLQISENPLDSLQTRLPPGLKKLDAVECNLHNLDTKLPDTLEFLDLTCNKLTTLPENIPESLKSLIVTNNRTISLSAIASLPNLTKLDASYCSLGEFPALPNCLKELDLSSNGLTVLPESLPASCELLTLYNNELTHLPTNLPPTLTKLNIEKNRFTTLPYNLLNHPSLIEVWAYNNPLSLSTQNDLNTQNNTRRLNQGAVFHFSNDFVYYSLHNEFTQTQTKKLSDSVNDWLVIKENDEIKQKWKTFEQEDNASAYSAFLNRLSKTVTAQRSTHFKEYVATWLQQLANNPSLRRKTFLIAQGVTETCEDRVTLTYNQMQTARIEYDIETGKYDQKIPELIESTRQLFRLEQLEAIARNKVKTLISADEIEVYLAYQVKLRNELELNTIASDMRFYGASHVTQDDLQVAEVQVKQRENNRFLQWLSQSSVWEKVLQRNSPEHYNAAMTRLNQTVEDGTYQTEVNRELENLGLKGDQDAKAQIGRKIFNEKREKIFIELTMQFLGNNGCLPLLDKKWPL